MLSSEDINTIVKRTFGTETVTVIDYSLNSYSKDKVGFLGDHQNLNVTVKRKEGNETETHRYFVKAVPDMAEHQIRFIRENNIFNQEAVFFNTLFSELKENYVGEDWCPKCYLANNKIIVLEDLSTKGYKMRDDKILQGEYLKAALRVQARLHASSVLAEARLGKSLKDLYPEACVEQIFKKAYLDNNRLEIPSDLAQKIAKRHGRDHRRIHAALFKGFMRLHRPEIEGKLSKVISHGDTWPNNYLFNSSNPSKCIIVDFQLVRYAPRMYDVAQLIYLSTTGAIRKQEEREAIQVYYEEFNETLKRNNPSLKLPTFEEILNEYEDVRLTAIFAALMYYPIIAMSKNELAKYDQNQEELYKEIMFRTKNDLVMEIYDRDANYASRLNELVFELVDYAEKLNIPAEYCNGVEYQNTMKMKL